jgi:uncharacterized protein YkwD
MENLTKRIVTRLSPVAALFLTLATTAPSALYAEDGTQTTGTPVDQSESPHVCTINYNDVRPTDYYYTAVRHLSCLGIVGGYPDNSFRPGNPTTRGQLAKIEVLAKGWPLISPPVPTFRDVPTSHTFYAYIETARLHNAMGGYGDGTFRPETPVTRSQLAKIVVTAEGWPLISPPNPTFPDVPRNSTFYAYVETAAAHNVVSGFGDGTFRPGDPATRGQISKIIYSAVYLRLTAEEEQTIALINARRVAMGLPALRIDSTLVQAARRHSSDIGPHGLCQHTGTDGSSPWDRIAQAGYSGSGRGEVVGCNYDTPLAVVDGWWGSPGHYGVLTGNDINDIGCGWWYTGHGTGWQTCVTGSSQ